MKANPSVVDLVGLEALASAVTTVPTIERKKVVETPATDVAVKQVRPVRDLTAERKIDAAVTRIMTALNDRRSQLHKLATVRDQVIVVDGAERRTADVVAELERQIADLMGKAVRPQPVVYAQYIAGRMTLGEAHEVIDDLIVRGVFREVDEAEKAENRTAWETWKPKAAAFEEKKAEYDAMYGDIVAKGDEEAEIPEAPRPPAKPQTIWSLPVITGNTRSYRHFAKRYFAKDEPRPEGYDPKVADTLIGAWVGHVSAEKQFRADKAEDRSKLLVELREKFKPVEGKTLTDVDAGFVGVVEVVLKPEHGYKDMRTERLLEGSIFVEGLGVDGVGIAKAKILGAVGSVWPGLSRLVENTERGQQATLFQWKARYHFDGIQAVEDARPLNFLLVLLRKAGGLGGGQKQTPASDLRQFKPQTRRGHRSDEDQGPRKAKGRKNGKGGRGRRDYSEEDSE